MPKELHEITKFTTGTITVPDEKDIPEDAASYSLNIDSVTEGGKLKGVPSDLKLLSLGLFSASGSGATVDAQVMAMINRDGFRDVVYFEEDNSKIHNIMGLYRTKFYGSTGHAAVEGGASKDTITNTGASPFITSGFKAGDLIHVSGFANTANNETFKIDSVAADTLTLDTSDDLVAESAGETVIVSSFTQNDMGTITSSEGQVSMQVHNKEVHVGTGKGSSDVPKWVGHVDHTQFGDDHHVSREHLNNTGDFSGSWTRTGDMAVDSTDATYTHSSAAGTLVQTAASRSEKGVANVKYAFTYTISNFTETITLFRILGTGSQFAAANTNLEQSNGTHITTFTSHATDPDQPFTIDVTSSTSGTFNIDNVSLKIYEPRGLMMKDAELKRPGSFPPIYNAVTVGSYVYGIQYGGTHIYRFSGTAFDSASYIQFTSTQGICLLSAGTDIWLYDDNGSFGSLYKIDVSEWGTEDEISQESNISGWGAGGTALATYFDISDIFDNGTVVWFQGFKDLGEDSGATDKNDAGWLFNATIPTSNGALDTTNVTPRLALGVGLGNFVSDHTIHLYKQGLVGMAAAGVIGVVCYNNATMAIRTDGVPNTVNVQGGLIMMTVGKDYTAADPTSLTIAGTDDYQVHEVSAVGSPQEEEFGGSDLMGGFAQDDTRLFIAKTVSSTSTTLYAMEPIVQTTISGGATSSTPHDTVPTARGNQASIDTNGLVPIPDADRNPVYMFENNDGGSFMKVAYSTPNFTGLDYLERADIRMSFLDTGVGDFQDDATYFWKCSYMYDGYQESPLSLAYSHTPAVNKNIEVTLDLYNLLRIPKRVSHIVLYRAEDSDNVGSANPDSFYRLVKKMKIDTSFALQSDGWGDEDYRQKIHVDQLNNAGSSYEARNLMPETLETSIINYALSTQINSMHIVGKCYKTEISDATNFLFKSKVNNFDQFDWTTDFLRLPTVPTSLASFNGRIYAFDENNTYRINPQGFYIEDTFEGAGCSGPQAVLVTEYGMCYCDKNNIYLHDGKSPKPIATPILTGGTFSWHNVTEPEYGFKVMFDAKRKSFMIFFLGSDNNNYAWAYNLIHNRWDLLHFHDSQNPEGVLHGKNGELFVAVSGTYLAHYLGSTSTTLDAWEWRSKYMTMNEDTVKKKFYDVNVINGGTAPTITYGVDGDTTPADTLSSGKVQSTHSKSKSLQIKLVQAAGATNTVDSVGVLYRRLPKTTGNI
jgi:hypothetical protein